MGAERSSRMSSALYTEIARHLRGWMRRLVTSWRFRGGLNVTVRLKPGTVVFVIGLKARASSANWALVVDNLRATLRSIENSKDQRWHVVVACHDRPPVAWSPRMTFLKAPFDLPGPGEGAQDRLRKWRLAASWLRRASRRSLSILLLDADDLISRDLVGFIASTKADALTCRSGYRHLVDVGLTQAVPKNFRNYCGSSFVARYRPHDLPADWRNGSERFLDTGAHRSVHEIAGSRGLTVVEVPFPAVVYIVNHEESMEYGKKGLKAAPTTGILDEAVARQILLEEFAYRTS